MPGRLGWRAVARGLLLAAARPPVGAALLVAAAQQGEAWHAFLRAGAAGTVQDATSPLAAPTVAPLLPQQPTVDSPHLNPHGRAPAHLNAVTPSSRSRREGVGLGSNGMPAQCSACRQGGRQEGLVGGRGRELFKPGRCTHQKDCKPSGRLQAPCSSPPAVAPPSVQSCAAPATWFCRVGRSRRAAARRRRPGRTPPAAPAARGRAPGSVGGQGEGGEVDASESWAADRAVRGPRPAQRACGCCATHCQTTCSWICTR